jgi:hypothetical protein
MITSFAYQKEDKALVPIDMVEEVTPVCSRTRKRGNAGTGHRKDVQEPEERHQSG